MLKVIIEYLAKSEFENHNNLRIQIYDYSLNRVQKNNYFKRCKTKIIIIFSFIFDSKNITKIVKVIFIYILNIIIYIYIYTHTSVFTAERMWRFDGTRRIRNLFLA